MSTRIVTVFGATGAQGSSVVKALLADGTFTPRAVTRDVNSEKALKLKELGVEVVQGDVWDVTSLKNAMNGAEAVFGVTAFWDQTNFREGPTSEVVMGKNLIDAAIAVDVKFYVWSSLPHCAKATNGKYRSVYHYDNKADVEEYLRKSQLPHANIHTGWFCENTWNYNYLTLTSDSSSYELTIPKYDPNSPNTSPGLNATLANARSHFSNTTRTIRRRSWARPFMHAAVGKPVRFVTGAATGMAEMDEMYEYQSEPGAFPHATIPDPRLERLGVKFHSIKTFAEEALKKRFA
ncbi:hypothetical protein JVT61DRAFT_15248 [Boletus reticuloceps]|uniref:NmrA-like domain-containing protein n=1 Tax=Boletus reticuloceps TaxID=495285 RepID=A0A8I2YV55_9AGAM|nr:hypothetical protein JVT61DRAFT_15248 [Boletus reticuloceps]